MRVRPGTRLKLTEPVRLTAVADGRVDAGVIIHESRFTFPDYGLHKVIDLGQWWEESTGHPIPLGGILARRALTHLQYDW